MRRMTVAMQEPTAVAADAPWDEGLCVECLMAPAVWEMEPFGPLCEGCLVMAGNGLLDRITFLPADAVVTFPPIGDDEGEGEAGRSTTPG